MTKKIHFSQALWLILAYLLFLLNGCGSLAGSNPLGLDSSWKEEVLLHDGRKIVVKREVERGGRHEPGQQGAYKEQRLVFTMPDTNQEVIWEDHFSPELGMSNFLPMLLDIFNNTVYLVVEPMGCLSYNKWGRPNPPYVIFKYSGNEWQRIRLKDLPAEIKIPNMIASMPDFEVEHAGTRFMTAEMIQNIIAKYKRPGSKIILREPLDSTSIACTEMIRVNDGWVGIEWFSSQPTYKQCLKVCKIKNVSSEQCPCDKLFKNINKEK